MIISEQMHVTGESHLSYKLKAGNIMVSGWNVVYSYSFFSWKMLAQVEKNKF